VTPDARRSRIARVVRRLLGDHGITAAIVSDSFGGVLAAETQGALDPELTAEWASDQVSALEGLRHQLPEDEFALLLDSPSRRFHIRTLGEHVLIVCFQDRDALGSVSKAVKALLPDLKEALGTTFH